MKREKFKQIYTLDTTKECSFKLHFKIRNIETW